MKKLAFLILLILLSATSWAGDSTTNSYFYLPSLGASGAFERTTMFNAMEATDGVIEANKDAVANEAGLEAAIGDDIIVDGEIDSIAELDTVVGLTGTASATTYLAGDGDWKTCAEITGSADLCDGDDADAGGGGADDQAYDEILDPANDSGLVFGTYTNTWTSTATGKFFTIDASDQDIVFTGEGNLGIGTSAPGYSFEIEDSTAPGLFLDGTSSRGLELIGASSSTNATIKEISANTLSLGTDNSIDISIFTGGNVGIGHGTDQNYLLAVNGLVDTTRLSIGTTTCLDVSSDEIFHDTDCDGSKDAGEEFIDQAASTPAYNDIGDPDEAPDLVFGSYTNTWTSTLGDVSFFTIDGTGTDFVLQGDGDLTTGDITYDLLTGSTTVDDDDCTGEQGTLWFDSTDNQGEICNDNSGVPDVIGRTAYDAIGDPDANGTIAFTSYTNTWTSTIDNDSDFFTIQAGNVTVQGNLELPQGTATIASDCDVAGDAGRIFIDTDASSGQQVYVCEGTAGWVLQGDGSGSGDSVTVNSTAIDTTANLLDGDIDFTHVDGGAGGPDSITASLDGTYEASLVVAEAAALTANPTDCGAGTYATTIAADGDLTCTAIAAGGYAAASIDGDDVNSNIAGRSLTLTSASPDTLDADAELYTDTKCITIETPADADDIMWFRADNALTVTGVDCIVEDATSAAMVVAECDADGNTCTAIEASITCATTNTAHASTIDNASVDAGDWVRAQVGTVTGTPGHVATCITFTWDD